MDVSIIIINYNSSSYTLKCIETIIKYTKSLTYEIIVVDNNSKTSELQDLKNGIENYTVKLIESKINLGFGGGNSLGYQFSKGKYLAFVNNDVEFLENSLLKLLNYIKTDSKIGCLGLPQINSNHKPFIYSYRQFQGISYQLFKQPKPYSYYSKLHQSDLKTPFEVDLVSGAFMFFKTEAYKACGGFDTNIFLYYEEMDIGERLRKSGYQTVFYPDSLFLHHLGKSSVDVKMKVEFTIAYLYVIQKNYSYWYYKTIQTILFFKYGIKALAKPKKYGLPFTIVAKGGNGLAYSLRVKN